MNIVKGFKCNCCGDIVYSRCKEDNIAFCHCGRVQVKGTPQEPEVYIDDSVLLVPNLEDITLQVDNDVLYWDWNLMTNDYGYISELTTNLEENKINEFTNVGAEA